ncbi:transcriptional regulator [Sphingobium yanoikuyae]|uniref:transcriptional regulator n=1 Tax=Sphingobium yanoikuyae TaxID=13690 RepID=UPI002FD97BA4
MAQTCPPSSALENAVRVAGGQTAAARICGVSQPAVWKWLKHRRRLPAEFVLLMETQTGVSRHCLRPDIYPTTHDTENCLCDLSSFCSCVSCDPTARLQRKGVV